MQSEIRLSDLERNEFYLRTKREMVKDMCWFYNYSGENDEARLRERIESHRNHYLSYLVQQLRTEDYLMRKREQTGFDWWEVQHLGMEMLRYHWLHQCYLAHLATMQYFERLLEEHLNGELDMPF